ncbi:hypothetical protein Syun_002430 [Stephania yunnanensis]|uniref:Uncharacterized protein n=1 Tax=Stephania yunnanensis TaxID=152371 RepID=A0AAP0Q7F1_9MAGN
MASPRAPHSVDLGDKEVGGMKIIRTLKSQIKGETPHSGRCGVLRDLCRQGIVNTHINKAIKLLA